MSSGYLYTDMEDTNLHTEFLEFLKRKIQDNLKAELMKAAELEVDNVVKQAAKDLECQIQVMLDRMNNSLIVSVISGKK